MDSVLTGVVALNVMLFTGLSTWALRNARRTDSPHFRELSQLVALVGAAFVVGALHRLALQTHRLGWWQGDVGGLLNGDLQLARSLLALVIGGVAFRVVMRLRSSLQQTDRVMTVLAGQSATRRDLPLAEMGLTSREEEVLALVGDGRVRDQEISEVLHISPHTARTHVRNILRKSGLSDRRELVFISQMSGRPDP